MSPKAFDTWRRVFTSPCSCFQFRVGEQHRRGRRAAAEPDVRGRCDLPGPGGGAPARGPPPAAPAPRLPLQPGALPDHVVAGGGDPAPPRDAAARERSVQITALRAGERDGQASVRTRVVRASVHAALWEGASGGGPHQGGNPTLGTHPPEDLHLEIPPLEDPPLEGTLWRLTVCGPSLGGTTPGEPHPETDPWGSVSWVPHLGHSPPGDTPLWAHCLGTPTLGTPPLGVHFLVTPSFVVSQVEILLLVGHVACVHSLPWSESPWIPPPSCTQ